MSFFSTRADISGVIFIYTWDTFLGPRIFRSIFANVYDYVEYMYGSDLSRIFLLLEIAVTIDAFEPSDHVNN